MGMYGTPMSVAEARRVNADCAPPRPAFLLGRDASTLGGLVMPLRRVLLLFLTFAGVWFFASGMRGYAGAWTGSAADPASVAPAGRASVHQPSVAAFGTLRVIAAAIGWCRGRNG